MFIPVLQDFSKRYGISTSKLMIPMSYGVILGGTCSLIGTSTNLVAYSLAEKARPTEVNSRTFGLFTIATVGLPVFFAGLLYTANLAGKWLPKRLAVAEAFNNPRDYIVLGKVVEGSPIDGKSIEKAKLRQLKGLFLTQILRPRAAASKKDATGAADVNNNSNKKAYLDGAPATLVVEVVDREEDGSSTIGTGVKDTLNGDIIPAPGPETILRGGDVLYFAGRVDYLPDIKNIPGLVIVEDEVCIH
jgi:hypothetical protein